MMTIMEIWLQEHMQMIFAISLSFTLGYAFALAMGWLGRRK